MEQFHRRTQDSFGSLGLHTDASVSSLGGNSGAEGEQWFPNPAPVFRSGELMHSSDEDDEEEEARRRHIPGSRPEELGDLFDEEEAPTTGAFAPTISFSSQLDREVEMDEYDVQSLQFDVGGGSGVGRLEGARTDDLGGRGLSTRRFSSGSSSSLKSILKRELKCEGKQLSKRVSFTGLPEPPKPYVPPFKRKQAHAEQQQAQNSAEAQDGGKKDSGGNSMPDYVKHPERYTMYELDEPIIIGGGVDQLREEDRRGG